MPGGIPVFKYARQYGFTTGAGAILNIVDDNLGTSYQPLATDFGAYTDQFFTSDGVTLNYGKSFPAIELFGVDNDHDPVVAQHISSLLFKVETVLTLGDCVVVGSHNPASSVSNTLQTGDVFLGRFTGAQIASAKVLQLPAMQTGLDTYEYYRILFRSTKVADAPTDPSIGSTFQIFDTPGAQSFIVPTYGHKLVIELWGGAASGGENGTGADGNDTTCSTYSLTAGKGHHATQTLPNVDAAGATGGTATGGNTTNTNGNPGGAPSPAAGSVAVGLSGKGGDAPSGGLGGDPVYNDFSGGGVYFGKNGQAPGGGGSGRNLVASLAGGSAYKYPGGGSGAYVRHELVFGASGSPAIGSTISFNVGAGGLGTYRNGTGANGRAKFSWT